jgi:hypothetical protein
MKKRLVSLLVLSVVLTAFAPLALADHCSICNASGTLCRPAGSGGKPTCVVIGGVCMLSGSTCTGPHPLIETEPLAAEFTVISVERLDEPQSPASETRVASLETTQTAPR